MMPLIYAGVNKEIAPKSTICNLRLWSDGEFNM